MDIARVDQEARRLAKSEHGIGAVDSVSEQQDAAKEAEIPKRLGDDARPRLLGGNPLHQEAHGKQELGGKTDGEPD